MTRQKSLKVRVRERMAKTGESYTTARRHVADKVAPTLPPAAGTVRGQRFSDESMRERTGKGWDEWFSLLDGWNGTSHSHSEIARWLVDQHGVDGWWAQSLTVGYEQARGLRVPGQQSGGSFAAAVSRTVAVPAERAFEAFSDETVRERWLPGADMRVRTATAPKSYRADWEDGSTRVVVGFTPKGDGKTQVALQHEKLPDSDAVARMKVYWRERLVDLKKLLEG